jgi:hypothetical protein
LYVPQITKLLKLESYSEGSVVLSWSDISDGEVGFVVEMKESNLPYTPVIQKIAVLHGLKKS